VHMALKDSMQSLQPENLMNLAEVEETPLVAVPSRRNISCQGDPDPRRTYATIASASFGATLLVIFALGYWNQKSPSFDDSDVETFYKTKFGEVQDMMNWKSGVMHLCKFSQEMDAEEVVKLPAAKTARKEDICQSKALWCEKSSCSSSKDGEEPEDDGSAQFHCCCRHNQRRLVVDALSRRLTPGKFVRIKVVSYNLEWWKIFGQMKGNGGSEGHVLAATDVAEPIDFIAFQECGDKDRVLQDAGLLERFATFGAPYQKCTAIRKDAWRWLAKGHQDIAADVYWNNFGVRGVMWQRLWHVATGMRVFFANFHGPLAINSGGCCGGKRTARNLLRVIKMHSEPGDIIILLGDFNANSASQMVKELRKSLVHVQSGHILGGIDHCFVNLPGSSVVAVADLGNGGSDHHAVSTVFQINTAEQNDWTELEQNQQLSDAIVGELYKDFPKDDWEGFWCGLEEIDASYNPTSHDGWVVDWVKVPTTDWCCRHCQREQSCKAFRFEGISGSNNTRCTLMHSYVKGPKNSTYLAVASGLPATVAIKELQASFDKTKVFLDK